MEHWAGSILSTSIAHSITFGRGNSANRNEAVIRIQVERRYAILKSNAELLARLRAQRTPAPIVQS
jgi:hypothetical protein